MISAPVPECTGSLGNILVVVAPARSPPKRSNIRRRASAIGTTSRPFASLHQGADGLAFDRLGRLISAQREPLANTSVFNLMGRASYRCRLDDVAAVSQSVERSGICRK